MYFSGWYRKDRVCRIRFHARVLCTDSTIHPIFIGSGLDEYGGEWEVGTVQVLCESIRHFWRTLGYLRNDQDSLISQDFGFLHQAEAISNLIPTMTSDAASMQSKVQESEWHSWSAHQVHVLLIEPWSDDSLAVRVCANSSADTWQSCDHDIEGTTVFLLLWSDWGRLAITVRDPFFLPFRMIWMMPPHTMLA